MSEAVSRAVVNPVVRAAPWDPEKLLLQEARPQACLLIISESDVCRSVLAAECLRAALAAVGLEGDVVVETCGTRPYNLGEGPESAVPEALEALGLDPPGHHSARLFEPAADIVAYDLLLVMDKYTASDVMREVSSFDLINRQSQFSHKVRRLGEFVGGPLQDREYGSEGDELDIEDPLYGNVGGEEEQKAVLRAGRAIRVACRSLASYLAQLKEEGVEASGPTGGAVALGPMLRSKVQLMSPTPWLVPPMLSARPSDQ
ncbi:hypothetical protein HYH03_016915 [Edaphochlamys debaryana]|uniref:protein-tyrosine-phosphatase n=1 Tax=Edaphochlamys debaryana TaxID=47281 RepID=A0A836BPF0_9CHLO|nr:hypothetical protein HYH03_016915 [Edaphochlamys debaryana]|eukprot:KAG2484271.1 hypothetical protein HYH03_016915 [Edaphochlamys debaryana]